MIFSNLYVNIKLYDETTAFSTLKFRGNYTTIEAFTSEFLLYFTECQVFADYNSYNMLFSVAEFLYSARQ